MVNAVFWSFGLGAGCAVAGIGPARAGSPDNEVAIRGAEMNVVTALTAVAAVMSVTHLGDPAAFRVTPEASYLLPPMGIAIGMVVIPLVVLRPLIDWILDRFGRRGGPDEASSGPRAAHGAKTPALRQLRPRSLGGVVLVMAAAAWLALAWIGHPIVAAMIATVIAARGASRSPHFPARARVTVRTVSTGVFAPLLFALVGRRLDFSEHFDGLVVALAIAILGGGKLLGVAIARRLTGDRAWRTALGEGLPFLEDGLMPLVLAYLLRFAGLIDGRAYTALVIAVVVTVTAKPLLERCSGHPKHGGSAAA